MQRIAIQRLEAIRKTARGPRPRRDSAHACRASERSEPRARYDQAKRRGGEYQDRQRVQNHDVLKTPFLEPPAGVIFADGYAGYRQVCEKGSGILGTNFLIRSAVAGIRLAGPAGYRDSMQ